MDWPIDHTPGRRRFGAEMREGLYLLCYVYKCEHLAEISYMNQVAVGLKGAIGLR